MSSNVVKKPITTVEHHSGTYTCLAVNPAGQSSAVFSVDVWEKPDIKSPSTVERVNQTVGHPVTLFCDVDSHPPPLIKWFLNGVELSSMSGLYLSDNNRKLTISSAHVDDIGDYVCEATNQAGSGTSIFSTNTV